MELDGINGANFKNSSLLHPPSQYNQVGLLFIVFMILFSKSAIPLKGSDRFPKFSEFKDKASAFIVKSRLF